MPLRKTVRVTLAVLLTATSGRMAWGHPVLEASDPGQGATVSSPKEVRLTFTENLIAKFSGLTIKDIYRAGWRRSARSQRSYLYATSMLVGSSASRLQRDLRRIRLSKPVRKLQRSGKCDQKPLAP